MRRYLFAGPSLPDAARLAAYAGVEVRPPVSAGDLPRLSLGTGDAVGIADGHLSPPHAVADGEILALLLGGVRVFGAAGVGALRAAELHPYGMVGVGGIYRDYRHGLLEAADEVALLHGAAEGGYRAVSEPLVNIRATLERAERAGLLDRDDRQSLIAALARLPYRRRGYQELTAIAGRAGLPAGTVAALPGYCARHRVNRQRTDALLLLEALRTCAPGPVQRSDAPPAVAADASRHLKTFSAPPPLGHPAGDPSYEGANYGVVGLD